MFFDPLLTTQQDHVEIVNAICQEFSNLPEDCALILMGHGTSHYANDVYAALDYRFKDLGFSNIPLATVEGYPTLENVTRMVKEQGAKKVILTPFMIVAGDHARNDMSGEDEDSWKNQFLAAGYDVECRMKGLGEYLEKDDKLFKAKVYFVPKSWDTSNNKAKYRPLHTASFLLYSLLSLDPVDQFLREIFYVFSLYNILSPFCGPCRTVPDTGSPPFIEFRFVADEENTSFIFFQGTF